MLPVQQHVIFNVELDIKGPDPLVAAVSEKAGPLLSRVSRAAVHQPMPCAPTSSEMQPGQSQNNAHIQSYYGGHTSCYGKARPHCLQPPGSSSIAKSYSDRPDGQGNHIIIVSVITFHHCANASRKSFSIANIPLGKRHPVTQRLCSDFADLNQSRS